MSRKECRDCNKPIEWLEEGGRWKPVEPGTTTRHRCDLDQLCEVCEKMFKGAPWMKVCPECYRNRPRPGNPSPAPARSTRAKEKLNQVGEGDDPF